jgi:hypothetical protein
MTVFFLSSKLDRKQLAEKPLQIPFARILGFASACFVTLLSWQYSTSAEPIDDTSPACNTRREQSAISAARGPERAASLDEQAVDRAAINAAFNFLDAQMDMFHKSTIIYSEPGFSTYYPGGKIGDVGDISIDPEFKGRSHSGRASLRIDYRPAVSSSLGWAGVYFLYPDGNWGQFPGRNLSGATKLSFWVCADHDTHAEFFLGGIKDPRLAYFDTLPKVSTGVVAVSSRWQRHEIDLTGHDLSSVIGGFGVATSQEQDARSSSLLLDDVEINLPALEEPRFVQSYVADDCPAGGLPSSAQVYDQALVLLAFLARGQPDDLRRADLIAQALLEARRRDRTFTDGRLRNAYASGELIDPHSNTTRIPAAYDRTAQRSFEDENAAGSDTGNMAWAALALLQAHMLLPKHGGESYLSAALSLAEWIVDNTKVDDSLGGFSAGIHGFERAVGLSQGQQRKTYRATEHNLDLDALFGHLAELLGRETPEGQYWTVQAAHARKFVDRMRNDNADAPYFWTGTGPGTSINTSVIPLDVQTWSVLRTRQPTNYSAALDWALKNCNETFHRDAFDFNCKDGDGVWWEGTAQLAAALRWLKRDREAVSILARLREAQLRDGIAAGALPAASRCGLTTGFDLPFRSGRTLPWLYPDWPHIGATAWFIFAVLRINPYYVADGVATAR